MHPIRLVSTDDLRRTRLTVFFRYLLAIPHFIWLMLWGIAAYLALIASWFATLFAGQTPAGLHGFLSRYLRYSTRVSAYTYLLADPFPPFSDAGAYPIDLEIDPPAPQGRALTFFRYIVALPAMLVAGILGYLLGLLAFLGWFAALFTGRMPGGLANLGRYCLRFQMQTNACIFLLTARYPSFSFEG